LTDIAICRAKPREKPYKLFDEKGMYQSLVSPAGAKLWRLKYRVAGKEKTLALGPYPERSLADARGLLFVDVVIQQWIGERSSAVSPSRP